ncbi:MAG: sigma-70 family RNA polymerase sigma factor [Planctomycetota bacterium]
MKPERDLVGPGIDPLLSDDPGIWDRLIEAIGPASMLVIINARMGASLRRRFAAEDVWQETLLNAWRDRATCEWRGIKSFRRWLLEIIENRLRNLAESEGARKRGGGSNPVLFSALQAPSGSAASEASGDHFAGPVTSTTPSRAASYQEEARAMQEALDKVPEEAREVLRLRLFEELAMERVAERLGLGLSAAKHRFRKAFETYHQHLKAALDSRTR